MLKSESSRLDLPGVMRALQSCRSSEALLTRAVELVAGTLADCASAFRLTPDGRSFTRVATAGLPPAIEAISRTLTSTEGYAFEVLRTRRHRATDLLASPYLDGSATLQDAAAAGIGSGASYPLTDGERAWGVFGVAWSGGLDPALVEHLAELVALISLMEDRLRAHEAAARSQALMEATLDAVDQGVMCVTQAGDYLLYNPAMKTLSGWELEDVERRGWPNLVYPDPVYRAHVMATIRSTVERNGYTTEWTLTRRDGDTRQVQVSSRPVSLPGEEQPVLLGTFTDLTAQRAAQRSVVQEQNLRTLGRLVGSVAHDFNNTLAAICGHAELLVSDDADEERHRAGVILEAARRGAALTDRMLALANPGQVRPVALDLDEELRAVCELVSTTMPEGVRLRVGAPQHLPPADADPGQLQQALLNLLANASEAVGADGEIRVTVDEAPLPDTLILRALDLDPTERHLRITVRDDGPGFSDRAREHLFEDFFTEKPAGHGMGLTIVRGFVTTHRGGLAIRNDRGAVVELYLPMSQRSLVPDAEERGQQSRGSERLWILDDEVALLEYVSIVLSRRGYAVRAFNTVGELVEAVGAPDVDLPQLLVLNIVLPTHHGGEVLRDLRRRGVTAPVLWMSGYTLETAGLEEGEPAGFLHKPFTGDELARSVRELLDRRVG
ncbi:MAG: PAS domain S-box protein [Alphaproteobacteria bacterium]|nr:PAS domain S-box protein [Alphaproteobacteria bacterium]